MLMRTAEPAFLVPGSDSGCVPVALDPTVAVDFVPNVTVLEAVFGVASWGLASPRFAWAWALVLPVLLVEGSELVCALAEKASSNAKKGIITRPRRCLGEANRPMF